MIYVINFSNFIVETIREYYPVNISDVDRLIIPSLYSNGYNSYYNSQKGMFTVINMNFNGVKDDYYKTVYNNLLGVLRENKINKILK